MALTPKQRQFVQEYLIDLNATRAAARAGYSEKTAYSSGQRLLKNVEIQTEIQRATAERERRTEITQDRVLEELGKVAFHRASDRSDSVLRVSNKLRALELIGRHLGMFEKREGAEPEMPPLLLDIAAALKRRGGR